MPVELKLSEIKAVVFDLDNTLVSSNINFSHLREQLGCPKSEDLLTFSDSLPTAELQQKAHQLILDHELSDAANATPMPGCYDLIKFLESHGFRTGIVTRNSMTATEMKLSHCNISVDRVVSREEFAPKPSPEALIALAEEWQISPQNLLYVGDYLYDLQTANNANMPCCLVTHDQDKPFEHLASLSLPHLDDLHFYLTGGVN
ncbi:HAD family hydrolase [Vibrio makurazakiensis]|uniref:HAD family hydrolase n=1 Tax=Vibrio makurazakiensis TaxID=2910250 RepID=UPI003D11E820